MFEKDLYNDEYLDALDSFFEQSETVSSVPIPSRQGVRPDARRAAAIVAKKIENARRMMSAFGRPMKF